MHVQIILTHLCEASQKLLRSAPRLALAIAVAISTPAFAVVAPAQAASETVLYNFPFFGPDYNGVIARPNGVLFGATVEGSKGELAGEVYRLAPPATAGADWRFSAAHKFAGPVGGPGPVQQLLLGADGALYGTTVEGGAFGNGAVFRLVQTPGQGWVLTYIYSFQNNGDGAWPWGGVVADQNGALYGTTKFGAANGVDCSNLCGVIYQLTPPAGGQGTWTESTLYQFTGQDGTWPNAGLLIDQYGILYGTTVNGGFWGQGTVFSLTPHFFRLFHYWTFLHLHDFEGTINSGNDGAQPNGGLIGGAGDLWGTTQGGGTGTACSTGNNCGTAFELAQQIAGSSAYTMIIRHDFGGATNDGAIPVAGLFKAKNGVLWGTASEGGVSTQDDPQGSGTVFTLTPNFLLVGRWNYATAWSFLGAPNDGLYPGSPLVGDKSGAIYGTTLSGGDGDGTVFQIVP